MRVLTKELGYEASVADPCLFLLFDQDRRLRGIISVATDRHANEEEQLSLSNWIDDIAKTKEE